MKRVIAPLLIICLVTSITASDNDGVQKEFNLLNTTYLDPGHKQKRGAQLGKDRSAIEVYLGLQPSFGLKLNFYGSKHGALTERAYMMAGMDFDSDIYAKFGVLLNPGKRNKNRALSNPAFGWWKLWRYVMIRQALEVGYKGYFLDPEDSVSEKIDSENYGGVTVNYTLIFDGNFFLDKNLWYFFDHRTARRIRIKMDAGIFLNLDKFDQHRGIGVFTGTPGELDRLDNDNIINDSGQAVEMPTYSVLSPFLNLSIGFAF